MVLTSVNYWQRTLLGLHDRPSSGLTRLDFGYCKVGNEGVQALATALAANPTNLTTLVLDHCKGVTDVGAEALATALAANTNLTTLGLKGTGCSAEGRAKVDALLKPAAIKQRKAAAAKASAPALAPGGAAAASNT